MKEVKTVQVGHKLIIMNGQDPLRYVDLTTNKVHQYKPERNWKRPLLKLFKRQPFEDVLFYPKRDGFKMTSPQPNVANILTTQLENICIWYDGTMRPRKGHHGDCTWTFDGQIYSHDVVIARHGFVSPRPPMIKFPELPEGGATI